MCDNVIFHDRGGFTAETQGDLANIIGVPALVMEDGQPFDPECCLCAVDLTSTAKEAGYEQSRLAADLSFDPFDYHWRKKP